MNKFVERMIRAAKLDVSLYEEVEADTTAMGQAMGVVVLSSMAVSIARWLMGGQLGILILMIIGTLIGWYIGAFMIYLIGTKLIPEPQTRADHGQLLRTIGFSSAPGILRILCIIPTLGSPFVFVTGIWMLVAMVVAVRQALDYQSLWRAVGVCLIGWLIQQALFVAVLFAVDGLGRN